MYKKHTIILAACALALVGCGGSSSSDGGGGGGGITFKGSCYRATVAQAYQCENYYYTDSASVLENDCVSNSFEYDTAACYTEGSLGTCKITKGDDGAYDLTRYYGNTDNNDDTLAEQQSRCNGELSTYEVPVWETDGTFGAQEAYADNFNTSTALSTDGNYIIRGDGCEISNNRLLCKSTGTSSGKLTYQTGSTRATQRVRADLSISGGDYNGSGAGALIFLWVDSNDTDSATSLYACGLQDGELTLKDNAGSFTKIGTNTDIATDGANFSVTFTASGTSLTCEVSGDVSETVTHTLGSAPSGTGYAALQAGWAVGPQVSDERNYAYWDNFYFERK